MKSKKNRFIVEAGVIAALYTALTYVSSAFGVSYLGVQFRVSEALTVLPALTPAAIPGLVIGCILGNIGSPFAAADIVFGSLATLLSSIIAYRLRKITFKGFPVLSFVQAVLFNAVVVGAEIAFFASSGFSVELFLLSALQVAAGETAVIAILGVPLYRVMKKLYRQ